MSHIDLDELERRHNEVMAAAEELRVLRQSSERPTQKLPPPVRLGLIDSLIVMASTLFGVAILIILVAAIFL